ncbi:hypothetical protein ACQKD0_11735, partial [Vreelandella aquamarina]
MRLGATPRVAQSVAALSRRWWHNSLSGVHHVLTVAYFDRLGMRTSDVIKSYLGLLCLGMSDYDAVENFRR